MKRTLCLALVLLFLLCGCGGELPFFVRDVDDLDNFHCHVYLSPSDETITLDGDDAKEAYRIVTKALRGAESVTDGPGDEQVDLIFYTGDTDPLDDIVGTENQYGCYAVGASGVVMYVASVETSHSFHYQAKPSVYEKIIKLL